MLHHPAGQRGVERRQRQCAVLEDLDELASRAEEQDRAELRVEAAADDQLVAVELDHRLDADPLEVFGADALSDRRLDGAVSLADRRGVRQVELHAADVGLVGDRQGMELEDDREADRLGRGDGIVLGRGDAGLHGRDAVGGQDLLRFDLGQDGPPLALRGGRRSPRPDPGGCGRLVAGRRDRGLVQGLEVVVTTAT